MSSRSECSRRDFVRLLAGSALWIGSARSMPAQTSSSPILFHDVAPSSGLDFILRNDAAGRKYQVETLPGGLAVIDFDNDGWPDLYCTNGASLPSMQKSDPRFHNRLYRNNRDGTFTDVTAKAGVMGRNYDMGAAVGDYDNDGFEDLFVAGVHGNTLFHNNGDGTFTDVTEKSGLAGDGKLWAVAAAWIDYDNDGKLDLFVSNYCDWSAGTDPVCGGLTPNTRAYCHPDMYRAEPMLLYHNNGDGTFTEVSREVGLSHVLGKGMGVAVADYDGDGTPDIFVANDNARNLLIQNLGRKMREVGVTAGVAYNGDGRQISGMGADFRDFDGDGRPDILMTGLRNETYELFHNNGDATFDDASARSGLLNLSRKWNGWGCAMLDLDNDGWLDIFVAAGGLDTDEPQANRVFRNSGGKFSDVSQEAGTSESVRLHRGLAWADFDNDGRLDVAVSSLNAPLELWMNRSPKRHWLQCKLTGTRSNRSALGAKVICRTGKRTQVSEVANSVGYASASDLRVHFGLGDETEASLEIHWPSRAVQRLDHVHGDQLLHIKEESDTHPADSPAKGDGQVR